MNGIGIIGIAVILVIVIVLFRKRSSFRLTGNTTPKPTTPYFDIDHKYNEQKAIQQKEIDRILDKINRKGINSLSKKEKEQLDAFSKK